MHFCDGSAADFTRDRFFLSDHDLDQFFCTFGKKNYLHRAHLISHCQYLPEMFLCRRMILNMIQHHFLIYL